MTIHELTAGGIIADHPEEPPPPNVIAPATAGSSGFNTLRAPLRPIACWRLEKQRFLFDESFPVPESAEELKLLAALMELHPGAPITIFGHADPSGSDDYNKTLSGRRAQAIFGILTRNVALWEKLDSTPFGGDTWGEPVHRFIANDLGIPAGTPRPPRAKLFRDYMDKHCRRANGDPFILTGKDFLAGGVDPGGKGDLQGCSEFNPILRFSAAQEADFARPGRKDDRDDANDVNRRVTVLLFRPGTKVTPERWPCPRATEGAAACRTRFFADAGTRRTPAKDPREHSKSRDTFMCRFYESLTRNSPCERILKRTVFSYGLEQRENLPWQATSELHVTSEDGRQKFQFVMSQGNEAGTHRVFPITDLRPGIRYRGEVRDGDLTVGLFAFAELFALNDPDDPLDVLPLPEPAPEQPLPPGPPPNERPFDRPLEAVDFDAVGDAAGDPQRRAR
jgi:OmpA family protein